MLNVLQLSQIGIQAFQTEYLMKKRLDFTFYIVTACMLAFLIGDQDGVSFTGKSLMLLSEAFYN